MKLVTFNIRCDFGQDGENNFEYRKDLILKKIAQEKPDMICFQEVLPHIAKWLKENLTEYYVIGCGRSPELRDEQVSIAYRKDRLNLMEMQSYWLSETPYVPASRYAEPVSYTHLRAHETRHDLVCRLLLEKKKTNSYIVCRLLLLKKKKPRRQSKCMRGL